MLVPESHRNGRPGGNRNRLCVAIFNAHGVQVKHIRRCIEICIVIIRIIVIPLLSSFGISSAVSNAPSERMSIEPSSINCAERLKMHRLSFH